MSAAFGRYCPAEKRFGDWAFRTIHHPATRADIAAKARFIRAAHGNGEAQEFLAYLSWLGTFPVINGAKWINKYGRSNGNEN